MQKVLKLVTVSVLFLFIVLGTIQLVSAAAIQQTLKQLVDNSSDIVRCGVTEKVSFWNEEKNFIYTRVTLQVEESLKGSQSVPSDITVIVPGGEVGEKGLGVEHAARFELGEEVVVFLRPLKGSDFMVTAWKQGKYTVEKGRIREKDISYSQFKNDIKNELEQGGGR